jgi:glycosyltransferase involved in cell wall biosynthesis
MSPYVTVLISVYNGEKCLKEAIDSILNQTFEDFEFLKIDDGSTDNSLEIIKSFNDKRMRIINNVKNQKIIQCLNLGIQISRGENI